MISGHLKALDTPMPYEEWEADGPLLIFLHGFPNNHLLWKPQIEAFKGRYHILNFNLPGSYDGRVSDRKYFRTHFIQDFIIEEIKKRMKEHKKKAILVGHDLGCFILDEVGKQLSAYILGQVFLSGMSLKLYTMKLKEPSQMMKSWYVGLLQLPVVPALARIVLKNQLRKRAYSVSHIREDSPLYSEAPYGFTPVYLYQELARKSLHLKKSKEPSRIPTLFLFGDDDRFLNIPTQAEVNSLYEKGTVTVFQAGHWLLREKIEEVNQYLSSYFETLSHSDHL